MDADTYQQAAKRTSPRDLKAYPRAVQAGFAALGGSGSNMAEELLAHFDQMIWCLGFAGEVGEVLDMLKKHWGHGQPLDLDKLKKENGDVAWYWAVLSDSFGFKASDVLETNIAKLKARYPDGFSVEASAAKADERGSGYGWSQDCDAPRGPCGCGATHEPLDEITQKILICTRMDFGCPKLEPCALHACTNTHCYCP